MLQRTQFTQDSILRPLRVKANSLYDSYITVVKSCDQLKFKSMKLGTNVHSQQKTCASNLQRQFLLDAVRVLRTYDTLMFETFDHFWYHAFAKQVCELNQQNLIILESENYKSEFKRHCLQEFQHTIKRTCANFVLPWGADTGLCRIADNCDLKHILSGICKHKHRLTQANLKQISQSRRASKSRNRQVKKWHHTWVQQEHKVQANEFKTQIEAKVGVHKVSNNQRRSTQEDEPKHEFQHAVVWLPKDNNLTSRKLQSLCKSKHASICLLDKQKLLTIIIRKIYPACNHIVTYSVNESVEQLKSRACVAIATWRAEAEAYSLRVKDLQFKPFMQNLLKIKDSHAVTESKLHTSEICKQLQNDKQMLQGKHNIANSKWLKSRCSAFM